MINLSPQPSLACPDPDPNPIHTLIVDDSGKWIKSLSSFLANLPDIRVVGIAGDGREGIAQIERVRPALVQLDVQMPRMDGLAAVGIIRARFPDIAVVMMSFDGDESTAERCLAAGAHAFVAKARAFSELSPAILRVCPPGVRNGAAGSAFATPQVVPSNGACDDAEQLRERGQLLDLAQDAIIVRDFGTRRIRFWNKGAERLYGWPATEAVNECLCELLLGGDGSQVDVIDGELLQHGAWSGELRQFAKDRAAIIVHGRATLTRDEDGQPRSVLIINTDLTEQKKIESQFLRVQRIKSIGNLAAGVAHDLNNILAPILMAAPLLRRDLSAEQRDRIISNIEAAAERGAQIVKQVLSFGRGLGGERRPLQVGLLVMELVSIMGETFPKDIVIETTVEPGLWPVVGDPTQLHQVLLNLGVNARDAMPAGGRLQLRVSNSEIDANYCSMAPAATPGPHVVITVTDNGSGIPRRILDQIFDPFFTTKGLGQGTGLGLSTTLGIVRNHGGFIHVECEPGKGTVFKIHLPAAPGQDATAESAPLGKIPAGHGECVLVVDDEEPIRVAVKAVLEASGYRTLLACDGAEALAVFAQNAPQIGVVLTAISMPFMDGVALIQALQKMAPTLTVIASTGQSEKARIAALRALRVHTVLAKPYGADAVLRAVAGALQSSRSDSDSRP